MINLNLKRSKKGMTGLCLLVILMVAPISCSTRLVGGLEEAEANRILGVLEDEGIAAVKEKEVRGRNVTWIVKVAAEDTSSARKILQETGLPKEKRPGMARLLESGGIIPTAEEQKNKKAAAIGEELSRTIESLGGVLEAKVVISLPDASKFSALGDEEVLESTASVLVRHRGKPTFSLEDIRRLVAGAVAGMKTENVMVILNKTAKKQAASKPAAYRKIGPFLVAPSSKNLLLGFIIVLLACNLTLAAIVVVGAFKIVRLRKSSKKETAASSG